MTNRELLKAPSEGLSALDRQRQFVLRIQLNPMPCPACLTATDALAAAGIGVDEFHLDETEEAKRPFRCPHCKAELELAVPAFCVGPPWHWQLKRAWLAERLEKARLYDELKEAAGGCGS